MMMMFIEFEDGLGYEIGVCYCGRGIYHNLSPNVFLVPFRMMLLFLVMRR